MRQIVLDTETTGLDPSEGHRIIEVGCVEIINRKITDNRFHVYINPERQIDDGAVEVHGITNQFLEDKPYYKDIASDLLQYLKGAELIIHNAPFDVGFLNSEYKKLDAGWKGIERQCKITDTLQMARKMHPGQKNSLDALCKRYQVDNSQRDLHGALLDAEILAELYLTMTGGQTALILDDGFEQSSGENSQQHFIRTDRAALKIIRASAEESAAHNTRLESIDNESGGQCLWLKLEQSVVEPEPV
ncbi:MAG: DNA polymerase III subunit epsilon [Thioalkalispiraceae bacterium]|jgi:DNA polymerase-3 subunit epsilon